MTVSPESRIRGAIWGVCVADALGGPVQFMDRGSFQPITKLEFVVMFMKPSGSYSDDGATTLALAHSFLDARGSYDHVSSIRLLLDWIIEGRFSTTAYAWDVGNSTRRALNVWQGAMRQGDVWREDAGSHVDETQLKVDQALSSEDCSGNGSLMRISPIGLLMYRDRDTALQAARDQSRITHPAPACIDACALYTELLCRIMSGEGRPLLHSMIGKFKFTHQELSNRLAKYKRLSDWEAQIPEGLRSSGWVVDTMEVVLWAFFKYYNWRDGALAVVNLGGDSDTAGAIYGGLAGAYFGLEAIPVEWLEGMQKRELIEEVASGLAKLASPTASKPLSAVDS